ncbi:MAG: hypothetical protein KDB00_28920, partial [Planctomycetales bacterium]|nr:hypothetical protein [Planctomycetales bacterium]
GATINSVRLEMTVSRSISGNVDVSLHRALGDWGEGTSNAPGQEGTGTTATSGDATWLHQRFPSSTWTTVGGDYSSSASAATSVGSNGRYAWNSAALIDDVMTWVADPSSNSGWFVIGDEQTVGSAKRFDSHENPVAANRPQLIIDFEVQSEFDFGDAPSAAQSGFAQSYPVLLADDGARHAPSGLFLGDVVDTELNGNPTAAADGDGADEDGISILTSLVSASSSTTAAMSAKASAAGKLDGWIDFNRDGDWSDAGEQIFSGVDVVTGDNLLSFTVAAGASVGSTAARFRISTAGGLAPTGAASDGEVEDYIVDILDTTNGAGIQANLVDIGQPAEFTLDANDFVVRFGQLELIRIPAIGIGSININGSAGDDEVVIDYQSGLQNPSGGVTLNGGSGENLIRIIGNAGRLDLAGTLIDISNFTTLQLSSGSQTEVVFNALAIEKLAPVTRRFSVQADRADQIVVGDSSNWRMTDPTVVNQQFHVTATEQNGGGETIEALVNTPWQNLVNVFDTNNDGDTTPLDALVVLNEIARGTYLVDDSQLENPLNVSQWPGLYIDTNGDGRATPLDALIVINRVAVLQVGGAPEGVTELPHVGLLTEFSSTEDRRDKAIDTIINEMPSKF